MFAPAGTGGGRRQQEVRNRSRILTVIQGSTHSNTSSAPPLSQIEKSVTHLLVATKQLLETLTLWSRNEATDSQVSDVYVRLGYEFNIACRAFAAINVDTSDLGNVPELLREILESTLSQEASQESLDKYLPKIRDIIIALLHGLKRKQQKLRQKQSRDLSSNERHSGGDKNDASVPRQNSTSSIGSAGTGVTTLLNEGIDPNHMPPNYQIVNGKVVEKGQDASHIPPRGLSMSSQTHRQDSGGMPQRDISRGSLSSDQSTLSSTTMQNIPVLPPYPGDEATMPTEPKQPAEHDNFPPPPPSPPKQNNALAALQNRGDLERRASRRFSTYQLTKHLGSQAPMPMPAFPPGSTRIPNRSRDLREGLNAVRGRQSTNMHGATGSLSRVVTGDSPNRVPSRISERNEDPSTNSSSGQATMGDNDSPMAKTPEDKLRHEGGELGAPSPDAGQSSATLNGPASDALPVYGLDEQPKRKDLPAPDRAGAQSPTTYTAPSEARQFVPEQSPQPGKELTLFLQYKTKIKKFVFADGYNDLSMARLQLAFIEKFAWNTHNNGVDLPEIYIQDPISGVRHELEDLNDIKDRSVLVLNVEALDEVKRHIDEGLGGLRKMVEGVQTAMEDQKLSMQRVAERQQDAVKEMSRLHTAPPSARTSYIPAKITRDFSKSQKNGKFAKGSNADVSELQTLRRDLAVVRQTFTQLQANMDASMSGIKSKAGLVKNASNKAAIPEITGDSGRAYVSTGKKALVDEADKLVGRVDDLQDIVEDLRKDVVLRGVRPLPRQLESVAKDLSTATHDLRKMQEHLKKERPIWTKIWEKELETVCNEREELTMQEDLAADLQDDLEKAMMTFALVEQATKEQMKDSPERVGPGNLRRGLNHVSDIDPRTAKDGVLGEVRALQPNHESRLEAIERAEKMRQRDLESRKGGEFQKELGKFVSEDKLKKSGGYEEVERIRKARDEKIRREVWERQNGITMADADLGQSEPEQQEEGGAEGDENVAPAS